jgi:hypothetical protein
MTNISSGLHLDCENEVGKLLYIFPYIGWGWGAENFVIPEIGQWIPDPFNVLVEEIYQHNGIRRGIVGKVESNGHLLDSMWFISISKYIGLLNFSDKMGTSNVIICSDRPGKISNKNKADCAHPEWNLGNGAKIRGNSLIARNEKFMVNHPAYKITKGIIDE